MNGGVCGWMLLLLESKERRRLHVWKLEKEALQSSLPPPLFYSFQAAAQKKGERGVKSDVCLSVYTESQKYPPGKSPALSCPSKKMCEALTKRARKQGYEWPRTKQTSF